MRRIDPLEQLGGVARVGVSGLTCYDVWPVKPDAGEGVVPTGERIDREAGFVAHQWSDLPVAKQEGSYALMTEVAIVDNACVEKVRHVVCTRAVVSARVGWILKGGAAQRSDGNDTVTP